MLNTIKNHTLICVVLFTSFVAAEFNPKDLEFGISLLLDNVPEVLLEEWNNEDLSVLNYINYGSKFISDFDTYKYIINVDEDQFQQLNHEMVEDSSKYWVLQTLHHWKFKLGKQLNLVNQILRRHYIFTVYLIENKIQNYIMLIDSDSGYNLDDLVMWLTNYESYKLPKQKNWCSNIDYLRQVRIIKVGDKITGCDEIMGRKKEDLLKVEIGPEKKDNEDTVEKDEL